MLSYPQPFMSKKSKDLSNSDSNHTEVLKRSSKSSTCGPAGSGFLKRSMTSVAVAADRLNNSTACCN